MLHCGRKGRLVLLLLRRDDALYYRLLLCRGSRGGQGGCDDEVVIITSGVWVMQLLLHLEGLPVPPRILSTFGGDGDEDYAEEDEEDGFAEGRGGNHGGVWVGV